MKGAENACGACHWFDQNCIKHGEPKCKGAPQNSRLPQDAKPIVSFEDSFDGRTDTLHVGAIPLCPHCGEWSYYTDDEAKERGGYTVCPFCNGKMYMPPDADHANESEMCKQNTETEKRYTHCAECGTELDDEYYTYRDNHIQRDFFSEFDGSDNAFCSDTCAGISLMLEAVENVKEGRNDE